MICPQEWIFTSEQREENNKFAGRRRTEKFSGRQVWFFLNEFAPLPMVTSRA